MRLATLVQTSDLGIEGRGQEEVKWQWCVVTKLEAKVRTKNFELHMSTFPYYISSVVR